MRPAPRAVGAPVPEVLGVARRCAMCGAPLGQSRRCVRCFSLARARWREQLLIYLFSIAMDVLRTRILLRTMIAPPLRACARLAPRRRAQLEALLVATVFLVQRSMSSSVALVELLVPARWRRAIAARLPHVLRPLLFSAAGERLGPTSAPGDVLSFSDGSVWVVRAGGARQAATATQAIDVLPSRTIDAAEAARLPAGGDTCRICLEPFAAGDVLTTLPCFHWYHERCIRCWLSQAGRCPVCKASVT